ncbi:MAG: hypothetical protein ACFFDE_10825 [Promethearchaeota archaeon]
MKNAVALIASIASAALLAGALLNSVALGEGNPILEIILQAIYRIESKVDALNAKVTEQQQQISELQSKLDSLNNTLTSRIEALELNQSALAKRISVLEDALSGPNATTFFFDRFDTGLDNWSYWGGSGYTLQWVSNTAMISGNGYSIYGGMQKVIELSEWDESTALLISFDWKATSGYPSSSVTNAVLWIQDADSGSSLYYQPLILGGTTDTGWRNYVNDISSYVLGHSRIRIILCLRDGWSANWHQTNTYDNISLSLESP